MSEPTLKDCINYMRSQIKQMEKYPRNYEYNLPYYRKTVELLETRGTTDGNCATCIKAVVIDERPHGEWKPKQMLVGGNGAVFMHNGFECKCGRVVTQKENFCPDCGADMRGGDEK